MSKSSDKEMRLHEGELNVMELLWSNKVLAAKDISKIIKEYIGWEKNTTYTVIKRLINKGAVRREDPGFLCSAEVTKKEIQDIVHFRIAVECSFLMQCGPNISDETLKKLDECIADHAVLQANGLTALQHWTSNMKFHLLLFSSYDNPYTYQKLKEAITIQTRFYVQKRSKKWQTPVFTDRDVLHQAVLDYLKQKNYTMASSILKADIEDRSAV